MGVLLLMNIHQLPSIADYWSNHKCLGVPSISAVFPANRFNHLLASLNLVTIVMQSLVGTQNTINYIKLGLLWKVFCKSVYLCITHTGRIP